MVNANSRALGSSDSPFDAATGMQFTDYYKTVRGYVREHMVQHNLEALLETFKPKHVIDVGGGEGRDALWLAEKGYKVTLVEPSAHMLNKARKRVMAAKPVVQKRIIMMQGDDKTALRNYKEGQFDLVLSHGVLMYELSEPEKHIERIFSLVRPKGMVSLVTKGLAGSLAEMIAEERLDEIAELQASGKYRNHLGRRAVAYDDMHLAGFIKPYGKVLDWYGVRVATDHMYDAVTEYSEAQLKHILELEAWVGGKESTRGYGQMLHFIAQKK